MEITIQDLSIEEKIGQMLMVGIEGNKITERTKKLILKYKIGGIILYKKNFNNYDEMLTLIQELKKLNQSNKIPLFISIDQEGGRVNRLPKEFSNLPAVSLIAQKLNKEGIEKATDITSRILKKSGFNMNFAPVLDINRYEENKAIGDRSFSENIKEVTECGIIAMKKFQENNIISVIKHFPGHGATNRDSHHILPKTKLTMRQLENEDLQPFRKAIESGADAILVGHLRVKKQMQIAPCSLSRKFILKNLRRKYNYRGIVISDDLKMRAVKNMYTPEKALIKAVNAGNDLIIFRYTEKQEEKSIMQLIKLIKQGKLSNYRINKSVKRILDIKEKYKLSDYEQPEKLDLNEINKQIHDIREIVLQGGKYAKN